MDSTIKGALVAMFMIIGALAFGALLYVMIAFGGVAMFGALMAWNTTWGMIMFIVIWITTFFELTVFFAIAALVLLLGSIPVGILIGLDD